MRAAEEVRERKKLLCTLDGGAASTRAAGRKREKKGNTSQGMLNSTTNENDPKPSRSATSMEEGEEVKKAMVGRRQREKKRGDPRGEAGSKDGPVRPERVVKALKIHRKVKLAGGGKEQKKTRKKRLVHSQKSKKKRKGAKGRWQIGGPAP